MQSSNQNPTKETISFEEPGQTKKFGELSITYINSVNLVLKDGETTKHDLTLSTNKETENISILDNPIQWKGYTIDLIEGDPWKQTLTISIY